MRAIQDIPEHVNLSSGLDGDACQHSLVVDIPNQFSRARLQLCGSLGALGSCGACSLVVKAIQVTACLLELLDPLLGL